jgi:MYXO-CTERM domain-containing protein
MRNAIRLVVPALGALVVCSAASASTVYGLDLRGDNRFFQSTTTDFVGDFAQIGAFATWDSFAMDMDLSGTTLWTALWDGGLTNEYGTVDVTTGLFTSQGDLTIPIGANVSGLSVDPVSGDWYLSAIETGLGTRLYVGDITTGVFGLVGSIDPAASEIDIAIDSLGNAYGHDITLDQLISINLATGLGTPIGLTGQAANFAQGMDFDYADNQLYATVYTGGGTGVFGTFNLATGFFDVLQSTTPLNAEMEMVVATPIPAPGMIALLGLAGLVSRRRRG